MRTYRVNENLLEETVIKQHIYIVVKFSESVILDLFLYMSASNRFKNHYIFTKYAGRGIISQKLNLIYTTFEKRNKIHDKKT